MQSVIDIDSWICKTQNSVDASPQGGGKSHDGVEWSLIHNLLQLCHFSANSEKNA